MSRTKHEHRTGASGWHAALLLLLAVGAGCTRSVAQEEAILRTPTTPAARLPAAAGDPHMQQVRALADPDFEVRTRAAQALVGAGADALPALGRAGAMPVRVAGGLEVSATRSVVRAILAEADEARLEEHLGSPWPTIRAAAATEVGARDQWGSIPRLLERLDDRDREVRAASAASLRRLTNQWFGYRAAASVGTRRSAAERWRRWWTIEGRAHRAPAGEPQALAGRPPR